LKTLLYYRVKHKI